MVLLVLHDLSHFTNILSAWHDAGAPAVTIWEGLGTRALSEQARRADLPLMPSVRDVLQADDMPRTTVISVVPDEVVDRLTQATEEVLGDLSEPGKGILFVVPVTRVLGLRPPPHSPAP
jgi:nitrogen regulatory protein PII